VSIRPGVGSPGERFERCIRAGGVALFPSDTVYGLACDPENGAAVQRLYALKRRAPEKAAAVMFFDSAAALAALAELGERTRQALARLMPGAVTALLPNPARRFPLACRADPGTLGLRIVSVPALTGVSTPVLQSSANLSGGRDARRLEDVAAEVRAGVDVAIDGGELPGVASTVIDLRRYEPEAGGRWSVLRLGAVDGDELAAALGARFHFHPATYVDMLRADIPQYEVLQEQLVAASGPDARRILDLGTGMGETARRLLERHPGARLVGIDEDEEMLSAAAARLGPAAELHAQLLQDPLPPGPFDLAASALAIHHLDGLEKADLFRRLWDVLRPGGRFVLADVIRPLDPADALSPLSEGYDKPSTIAEQLRWLEEAGFSARLSWGLHDLAVIVADRAR
jgi:tRNA threonylcarbamoyl adenosine modification protein (Sua5/YciO/YrdC/YwlC family)